METSSTPTKRPIPPDLALMLQGFITCKETIMAGQFSAKDALNVVKSVDFIDKTVAALVAKLPPTEEPK